MGGLGFDTILGCLLVILFCLMPSGSSLPSLMPSSSGKAGRPFNEHRLTTEGIIYRYRAGNPWRDLPPHFGAWQAVWKRHRCDSLDGTWGQVLAALLTRAAAAGLINCAVSVHSTVNRAHRHGTRYRRGFW